MKKRSWLNALMVGGLTFGLPFSSGCGLVCDDDDDTEECVENLLDILDELGFNQDDDNDLEDFLDDLFDGDLDEDDFEDFWDDLWD
ncbi:MAG: hypothetical protein KF841_11280 [Phycisphaerae bacterium]|nr:hypothetical protein [Phycisphaerae bacterium]